MSRGAGEMGKVDLFVVSARIATLWTIEIVLQVRRLRSVLRPKIPGQYDEIDPNSVIAAGRIARCPDIVTKCDVLPDGINAHWEAYLRKWKKP